jgi:hypothetical protein
MERGRGDEERTASSSATSGGEVIAARSCAAVAAVDSAVERTVEKLRQLARTANLKMTLEVGSIVVDGVYGGDLAAVRRGEATDVPFRKLAAHPNVPFGAVTLWRAVGIYELSTRFPGIAKAKHLGVSHLRAILGLPHDAQERLLRAGEQERWTTDQLEQQASILRPAVSKGAGRRPLLPAVRSLRQVGRIARSEALGGDLFERLDERALAGVLEELQEVQAWCHHLESAAKRRLSEVAEASARRRR